MLAESSARHLREARQRGFERGRFSSVLIESMLMADGFGIAALANLFIEPAAGIFATRFAGQRQSPFAETFFQIGSASLCQLADGENAQGIQVVLHHFSNARNSADAERRN